MKLIAIEGYHVYLKEGAALTTEEIEALREFFVFKRNQLPVCPTCRHNRCKECNDMEWGISQIKGIKCCKCSCQHSNECWQSGARNEQMKLAGTY